MNKYLAIPIILLFAMAGFLAGMMFAERSQSPVPESLVDYGQAVLQAEIDKLDPENPQKIELHSINDSTAILKGIPSNGRRPGYKFKEDSTGKFQRIGNEMFFEDTATGHRWDITISVDSTEK